MKIQIRKILTNAIVASVGFWTLYINPQLWQGKSDAGYMNTGVRASVPSSDMPVITQINTVRIRRHQTSLPVILTVGKQAVLTKV